MVRAERADRTAEAGRQMGLLRRRSTVPGGRIDVVWLWRPPRSFPGLDDLVAVVGFEVESSWRTRKHVKVIS